MDGDLVSRALRRDPSAVRDIIKRHNQRLYRLARAVVGGNSEAEDVVQEAYLHAFANLESFRGESSLSTWLCRITLNEALARLRKRKRLQRIRDGVERETAAKIIPFPLRADDPERTMAQRQLLDLVEHATDELPEPFRVVFVARVIEGLSVEETAALFGLQPATVKTRLHRARKLVRERFHFLTRVR